MVGPEVQTGPLSGRFSDSGKESARHDAFLMMAPLGPRVGKKDEDRREAGALWDCCQEVVGVRTDKMQVREACPLALAIGPCDPIGSYVDPDAKVCWVRRGIGHEEVAMAASYFPYEAGGGRDDPEQRPSKGFAPIGDAGGVLQYPAGPQAFESPSLPASIATMSRLMSVGLTPLMRLAWPSVRGFI